MKIIYKLILINLLLLNNSHAKMITTYRMAESELDTRYEYDRNVLKLALEKTVAEYGDFELKPNIEMNFSRAISDFQIISLQII